jgi:hypothetical protein
MKVYITRPPAYASSPDHVVRVSVDSARKHVGVEMCIVFSPNPSEPLPDDESVLQSGEKFYKVIAVSEFDYELLKKSTGWADRQAWHLTFDPLPIRSHSIPTRWQPRCLHPNCRERLIRTTYP